MTKAHVPFKKEKLKLHTEAQIATSLKTLLGNDENAYQQFLERDLHSAYEFVLRELHYHDALNDLSANEIDPYDVIDQAILAVLEEKKETSLKLDRHLKTKILKVLHELVGTLEERERRETSIEENVQDPVEEDGFRTLGEHVLDYWQPDNDEQRIDVIGDTEVPTPAEILDMKERQADVYAALAALTQDSRENFVLHAVEGWTFEELASWRDSTKEKIKQDLTDTEKFLLARLREKSQDENRPPRQLPHTHDRG